MPYPFNKRYVKIIISFIHSFILSCNVQTPSAQDTTDLDMAKVKLSRCIDLKHLSVLL
jgi:hypothetical protein